MLAQKKDKAMITGQGRWGLYVKRPSARSNGTRLRWRFQQQTPRGLFWVVSHPGHKYKGPGSQGTCLGAHD